MIIQKTGEQCSNGPQHTQNHIPTTSLQNFIISDFISARDFGETDLMCQLSSRDAELLMVTSDRIHIEILKWGCSRSISFQKFLL